MEEERILVIHPTRSTLEDLDLIYYDRDVDFEDDNSSTSKIRRQIMEHKKIMLLGDGNQNGLRAKISRTSSTGEKRFIGPEYAQFLRNKEIIGIFNGSRFFAMKYGLTGLFVDDLIFSQERARQEFINIDQTRLELHKYEWCLNLANLLKHNLPYTIPSVMKKLGEDKEMFEKLNYSSFIYLIDGKDADTLTY